MKTIYLLVLTSLLIQACSTVKLTPEEKEEMRESQKRRLEMRMIRP